MGHSAVSRQEEQRGVEHWQPTAAVAGQGVVNGCCTVSGRNKREVVTRDCGIA